MAFNNKNNQQNKSSSKGSFSKLGQILRRREDGGLYIKFDDKTSIVINGVEMSGKTANLEKPSAKFERMLAAGAISEEEAEEKIAQFEDGGKLEFVRQEISVKLA
jgi:hypothetical protein